MFWKCTCTGLAILAHWQTYAAALIFLSVSLGAKFLADTLSAASPEASAVAHLAARLLLAVGQVSAIVVFVNIMCPLMLGLSVHATWSWPLFGLGSGWGVVRCLAALVLLAALANRIPLLGRFPSVVVFLIGGVVLVPTLQVFGRKTGLLADHYLQFWPGFWFMAALFSIGAALTWLGTLVAAMPAVLLEGRARRIGALFSYPLAAAFGFIPLYIYCAWLRDQIGTS